ncbi:DUF2147 domain-containing protein [Euzebyella marina]|uniref:DUF2147 domain-containing protein n=1 Tax=Euzebyella marina TaxID=1761453 RepID=A0A3G2L6L3_9FLAO|nr:DUF2147 domain-containing protein [Euzebyella marina]AYN67843.1 DUF2147 domain-containing protein [Euzebyella marina]MBG49513.1 hypothetical protein [Pseudozobellia sp.]|tara:strand:+ start:3977 stop:4417 length:441 start_codon:yes stop_codon:yes gene_type:complete
MIRLTRCVLWVLIVCSSQLIQAQEIFGKWKTIDDRTGKPKAIVEIYEKDGLMYGKVIEIVEEGKENFICEKCEGKRKNKPVLGMDIIEAAEHTGDGVYKGDTLFDPQQAMTFRCKIWLNPDDPDELKVRGYLSFLYRTQTWQRVEG